jgi:hypothetical protein
MHELFKSNISTVMRKAFGAVLGMATVAAGMVDELFDDPGRYGMLLKLLPRSAELDNRERAIAC